MTEEASPPGPPKPGEGHARLKPFEGTFRAKVTIHFGPDQKQESTGMMTNRFELDGLYLHQDYVGDVTDGPFPNFLGKGYWGYNDAKATYEGFWIDNASTMMQMESGDVDSDGQVWTMHSQFTHPASGKVVKRKTIITLEDHDHHRMDSFFSHGDEPEAKTMEIEYERV